LQGGVDREYVLREPRELNPRAKEQQFNNFLTSYVEGEHGHCEELEATKQSLFQAKIASLRSQ
jgi:hypothetical protein